METIFQRSNGKWYFCDETWGENGEYDSREDAEFAQEMYIEWQLEGQAPPEDEEALIVCKRLGIDVVKWAEEIRDRINKKTGEAKQSEFKRSR